MKKILLLTALMMLSAFALPAQEKRALLMVHFGTTYDDTRANPEPQQ